MQLVYDKKGGAPLEIIKNLYPWQQKILDYTKTKLDDEMIIWIYDKNGNTGKTAFCKYMSCKEKIIMLGGSRYNVSCILSNYVKNGRNLNQNTTFIFDYVRCKIHYDAIDSVRNGIISNRFITINFNMHHVIVFSNELPNNNKLAHDKLIIYELIDKDLRLLTPDDINS